MMDVSLTFDTLLTQPTSSTAGSTSAGDLVTLLTLVTVTARLVTVVPIPVRLANCSVQMEKTIVKGETRSQDMLKRKTFE